MTPYETVAQQIAVSGRALLPEEPISIEATPSAWEEVWSRLRVETCHACKTNFHPSQLWRCYFCKTWFCSASTCAQKHFGKHLADDTAAETFHKLKKLSLGDIIKWWQGCQENHVTRAALDAIDIALAEAKRRGLVIDDAAVEQIKRTLTESAG